MVKIVVEYIGANTSLVVREQIVLDCRRAAIQFV